MERLLGSQAGCLLKSGRFLCKSPSSTRTAIVCRRTEVALAKTLAGVRALTPLDCGARFVQICGQVLVLIDGNVVHASGIRRPPPHPNSLKRTEVVGTKPAIAAEIPVGCPSSV